MTPETIKAAHQSATEKREFWPGHWHMAALLERLTAKKEKKNE